MYGLWFSKYYALNTYSGFTFLYCLGSAILATSQFVTILGTQQKMKIEAEPL